jgi:hypothetical protein
MKEKNPGGPWNLVLQWPTLLFREPEGSREAFFLSLSAASISVAFAFQPSHNPRQKRRNLMKEKFRSAAILCLSILVLLLT